MPPSLFLEAPVIWSSRANQFLKDAIRKIIQVVSINWKEALPIARLHTRMAHKATLGLSFSRLAMGDHSDILLDRDFTALKSYATVLNQFQKPLRTLD